jgi:class 3 adenylate cyclase
LECPSCRAQVPQGSKFCNQSGTALAPGCSSRGREVLCRMRRQTNRGRHQASPPPAPAASSAERRPLTVMFRDLVGSTALSTQVDPEDLRELVNAYHRGCAERAARFGGNVAKCMATAC